jgi:hypothetical protein
MTLTGAVSDKTDFTGWPWRQGQTGNQPEGFAMTIRNDKGQFVSTQQALIADLEGFIADWTHWAKQALRKGDKAEAQRCAAEARDCRQKLEALAA